MSLHQMNQKWKELEITDCFVKLHHFNSSEFASNASTLDAFVSYCADKEIRGQNQRTIQRALYFAEQIESGVLPFKALKLSWLQYPLVKECLPAT